MPSIFPRVQWLRERTGEKGATEFVLAVESHLTALSDEWLCITDDNRLVPDSFVSTKDCQHSVYLGAYSKCGRRQIVLPNHQLRIEKPVYILGGSSNYAHWVLDVLPRLRAWFEFPEVKRLPLLVDAIAPQFCWNWLHELGVPESALIKLPYPASVVCDCAVVPSLRSDMRFGAPCRNASQLKWLRERVNGPRLQAAESLIYVTRGLRDPSKRRVIDEDQLVSMLSGHGFEVCDTEGMCIADQVALFRRARVVVSVHGAALANSIFTPECSHIVELVNSEFDEKYGAEEWFVRTSSLLGQGYTRVKGVASADKGCDDRSVNRLACYDVRAVEAAIMAAIAKPTISECPATSTATRGATGGTSECV